MYVIIWMLKQIEFASSGKEWLLKDVTVGTLCDVVITAVNEHGALCNLKNGVKGFVVEQHTEGRNVFQP